MQKNNVVAMILAGGKGTRLESLTRKTAKPAVSFAAKYRIIDFPISNCANSGINVVGVLTQYESTELDAYIGNGEKWGLNGVHCLMSTLPPRQTETGANWYKGTADAIAQNIDFLDNANPDYVVLLSGDHIYKTTYSEMIDEHIESGADVSISVIEVPIEEASRFGIVTTNEKGFITEFHEKPRNPKSNLASMGVYVFSWKALRRYLIKDMADENSSHDFGKDIIPTMLSDKRKLKAYTFKGYWRDVGTIASLHEANMDIALNKMELDLYDMNEDTRIFTEDTCSVPQYIGKNGSIKRSIVNQGATVLGKIDSCVVSTGAVIEAGAICTRAVIMEGAIICKGAVINNVIVAPGAEIKEDAQINVGEERVILVSK